MWTIRTVELPGGRGQRFAIALESRPASYGEVLGAWQDDADFRALFNAQMAKAPYKAFRWETPAVTSATLSQAFECVLLDCPSLARRPEPDAFAEHFDQANDDIAVFSNLGGDAIMIVPCPIGEPTAYGHLAAFVQLAPQMQQDALWRTVGQTMAQRIGVKPVWLSTAGTGVSWLHVRLDDRPKYYGFEPFR